MLGIDNLISDQAAVNAKARILVCLRIRINVNYPVLRDEACA